jgi:hypothetical protein
MRKCLAFILTAFTSFSISISNASDCTKACSAEGKPYIDLKVSDEKFFLMNYCQLRCSSNNFACRGNPIPDDVRRLKNDANWANNCKSMSDEAFTHKSKNEAQEEQARDRAKAQERLRENDRKHQATMEEIRNQQSQPASQASTQTSQNNYPSDSQSASGSSSSSGFLYDNYDHTRCISVNAELNKRRLVYKNGCSYPIYVRFCQVTDDSASYNQFQDGGKCPGGWGGMNIQANGSDFMRAWSDFNNYRFFMYACKEGWSPVNETGNTPSNINESWLCRKLR